MDSDGGSNDLSLTPFKMEGGIPCPGDIGSNGETNRIKIEVDGEDANLIDLLHTSIDIKDEASVEISACENLPENEDGKRNSGDETCNPSNCFQIDRRETEVKEEDGYPVEPLHIDVAYEAPLGFSECCQDRRNTFDGGIRNPSYDFQIDRIQYKGEGSYRTSSESILEPSSSFDLPIRIKSEVKEEYGNIVDPLNIERMPEGTSNLFECENQVESSDRTLNLQNDVQISPRHFSIGSTECSSEVSDQTGKFNLVTHMRKHTGEKSFTCSHCSVSFSNKGHLVRHIRSLTGERPFSCSHCNASFSVKGALKSHLRTHTGEKRFSCTQCSASLTTKQSLKHHVRTHTGEKPFSCSHCNASFSRKDSLRNHILTHNGEKRFSCTQCSASFSAKSTLKYHVRTHTGKKPFCCTQCSASLATKQSLKHHLRTHTGEKPYSCSHCNASFSQKTILSNHIRTHTGEKPFQCGQCSASFAQNGTLKNHLRTHSVEKRFTCSHCNVSFARKAYLNLHMRKHTRETIPLQSSV